VNSAGRKPIRIIVIERIVTMSVVIPNEILTTTRMTEDEMKREIAVMLFEKEKLTLAQASRFAGMNRIAFQHLLASRQIPVHYGVEDFEQDINNLRQMGRL
jgi:predicted HTH domain antitoxin